MSYKKHWKLLIHKDMMKKDLAEKSGISTATFVKMGNNENVNTEILVKICSVLDCDISEIMELIPEVVE